MPQPSNLPPPINPPSTQTPPASKLAGFLQAEKMNNPFYVIQLPMPVSINAAHVVGRKYGKGPRMLHRSPEYVAWLQYAGIEWRKHFPAGVAELFTGRIRVEYIFAWVDGKRGSDLSDVDNRIKVCQDFFQKKFFENDKQIDEIAVVRRLIAEGENFARVRIMEIPDYRFEGLPF